MGVVAVLAACVLLVATALVLNIPGRNNPSDRATQHIPSPDGTRVLVTNVNTSQADPTAYLNLEFEIREAASDEVQFHAATGASTRMSWSLEWISNREVKLTSSDIGDYCWIEAPAGSWDRSGC